MRKYSDPKIPETRTKKRPILRYIFFFILCVLGILQVFTLNSLSTKGRELTQTETSLDQVEKENELLEAKVASASAMTNIYKRAKDFGLVETPKTISLNAPIPVAKVAKIIN